jgi:hypothetical protein
LAPVLCDGVEPADIARYFLDRGVLVPGDNGSLSKSQQVIGGSGRFYALRLAGPKTQHQEKSPIRFCGQNVSVSEPRIEHGGRIWPI